MSSGNWRVVYDCNVHLQALLNANGPAGRCVEAALDKRVQLFWSSVVAAELRRTAQQSWVRQKFRHVTAARLEEYLNEVERVAYVIESPPRVFSYTRDPDDEHYIDLAVAAKARLVVSRDKDLLTLMDASTPDGRRFRGAFPGIDILNPPAFLQQLDQEH